MLDAVIKQVEDSRTHPLAHHPPTFDPVKETTYLEQCCWCVFIIATWVVF